MQNDPFRFSHFERLNSFVEDELERVREEASDDAAMAIVNAESKGFEAGRTAAFAEVREMIKRMQAEFPKDAWNEQEQGSYKTLSDVLRALKDRI